MNYMLLAGLVLFSSGSGALLVALLHTLRSEPLPSAPHAQSDSSAAKREV